MQPDVMLLANFLKPIYIVHVTHKRCSSEGNDGDGHLAIGTVLTHLLFERSDVNLLRVAVQLKSDYIRQRQAELRKQKIKTISYSMATAVKVKDIYERI